MKVPTIPFMQTKRADLRLREENMHALSLAGLQSGVPELLCLDDLSWSGAFPSNTFGLVDHNRLLPQFNSKDARVVAVIDHHDDEGLYTSSDPRIVAPAGSCASHVALLCPAQIPAELATLLLCAILIDTSGLKVKDGGKTLAVDLEAAALLIPKSPLYVQDLMDSTPITPESNFGSMEFILNLTTELSEKKSDVSHLDSRDLLRRDYKQYQLDLSWAGPGVSINAGLSTVPIGLKTWIPKDSASFWSATKEWMGEKELSVLGILTSFRDESDLGKKGKPKHKREQLWVIRDGASGPTIDADSLAQKLWVGLENSEELELEKKNLDKFGTSEQEAHSSLRVRVYKQGNTDATRKTTAPLMKSIFESP